MPPLAPELEVLISSIVHGYSLLRTQLNQGYFHDLFNESVNFGVNVESHRKNLSTRINPASRLDVPCTRKTRRQGQVRTNILTPSTPGAERSD
jgi:hypothetical protein